MEAHHKHTPASLQLLTLVEGALFGYRWLFLFWHMPSLGYIFAYLQAFAFEAFMRWIIWKEMSRFANVPDLILIVGRIGLHCVQDCRVCCHCGPISDNHHDD